MLLCTVTCHFLLLNVLSYYYKAQIRITPQMRNVRLCSTANKWVLSLQLLNAANDWSISRSSAVEAVPSSRPIYGETAVAVLWALSADKAVDTYWLIADDDVQYELTDCLQYDVRCYGAMPFRHLLVHDHRRLERCSQVHWQPVKFAQIGVIWLNFPAPVIRRAAAFWMTWDFVQQLVANAVKYAVAVI